MPGVLSAASVQATARSIAAVQEPSGAIGWPDGHVDVWDHIECAMALSTAGLADPARRAYDWLRREQRADGSWPRTIVAGTVTDAAAESNHAAYVAAGVWHELQVTGDRAFAARMWPTVRRAVEWVLDLQAPGGEIAWERDANGVPGGHALLTGCASIHHSLRCAVALAGQLGESQPDWELAADQLAHAVAWHPTSFADKSRFSMDWYYPVLGGVLRGPAADRRLAAGLGHLRGAGPGRPLRRRPSRGSPEPRAASWCWPCTPRARARPPPALFADVQHLRDSDGAYWTGWQFAHRAALTRPSAARGPPRP